MEQPVPLATLQSCLQSWRAFDLPLRAQKLSEEVTDLGARVEQSKQARLALTDSYKAWKRLDSEPSKLAGVVDLIRQFQGNDDSLQKRSKAAEASLLTCCSDLLAAADPVPALTLAVQLCQQNVQLQQQAVTLSSELDAGPNREAEVRRLQREVAELESELGKLTSQDITIRSLEGRLAELQDSMEAQVAETLSVREAELRKVFDSELDFVRESEAAMEARVAALQANLQDAQLAKDEAQAALYTVRSRAEEDVAAARAEADASAAELERLRRQAALAAAGAEEWRRKAEEAEEHSGRVQRGDATSSTSALLATLRSRAERAEEELSRAAASMSAIQAENRKWADLLDSQRATHEAALVELRTAAVTKDSEIESLKKSLATRAAPAVVAELRRQIALLQAIQSGAMEGDTGSADGAAGEQGGAEDIHVIMLNRIRQLENRAVHAEAAQLHAVGEVDRLVAELQAVQEQLEEQKGLVAQVDGLVTSMLTGGSETDRGAAAGARSAVGNSGLGSDGAALTSILTAADTRLQLRGATSSSSAPGIDESGVTSSGALLTLLRGQRDKFRARTLELETELQVKLAQLAESTERAERMRGDNLRLFEKCRYLSSALQAGRKGSDHTVIPVGSPGGVRSRPHGGAAGAGGEEEAWEQEYSSAYREGVLESLQVEQSSASHSQGHSGGLADFRRREQARTFQRMSTGEKLTVTGSKMFLANKSVRRVALLYAACLHLLVFFTVMHFANTVHDSTAASGCQSVVGLADAVVRARPSLEGGAQ